MDAEAIEYLLSSPRESLGVEIKSWIDPSTNAGKAKIAKACLALRNYGGGVLLVGFSDSDGSQCPVPDNFDVSAKFHVDEIQQIVSHYASSPFEVSVHLVKHGGISHPLIEVPSGVTTPVACKRDLDGGLKCNQVYIRTLSANNRVSSCEATSRDWERIVKVCFDNREADIGAFVRRHLSSGTVPALLEALSGDSPFGSKSEPSKTLLESGRARFDAVASKREIQIPPTGWFEAAASPSIVRSGPLVRSDIQGLDAGRPRYSGWSPWVILLQSPDEAMNPYALQDAWECLAYGGMIRTHLDFWRIESNGNLYALRALEDDLNDKVKPRTVLDPYLQCMRVFEYLLSVCEITTLLLPDEDDGHVDVGMKWSGLEGRTLSTWSDVSRWMRHRGTCHEDFIMTSTRVEMTAQPSSLAANVEELLAGVLQLFGGLEFERATYEAFVEKVLSWRH